MLTFTDWYKSGWEALTAYIDEHAEALGFRLKIDIIAGGGEGEKLVRAKFATGDLPDLLQTYGPKWLDHNAGVLDQIVPLQNVDMSEYSQDQLEEGHYISTVSSTPFRWTPPRWSASSTTRTSLQLPALKLLP